MRWINIQRIKVMPLIFYFGPLGNAETESTKNIFEFLNRLGDPKDVAEVALGVLGTPWMTGARIVLDGGLLLRG